MHKFFLVISILFVINRSFSQETLTEPQNVLVNWKVGTSKTISQTDSTIIYNNDTLFLATEARSSYIMSIVSQQDTVYEVKFKQITLENDLSLKSEKINTDTLSQIMQGLIAELQQKVSGLEYSFLVNKNTATAFEIKNQEELEEAVKEMVNTLLIQFIATLNMKLDESRKSEIQQKIEGYMAEQMPAAMETMLNSFNYIFQVYSFPYITNDTYTQDVDVYSIDQVNHKDQENKAQIVVTSSAMNTTLEIDYKYLYDKEEAYQMYIVAKGNGDKIPIEAFDIDERVISQFDLLTSWITKSVSLVDVRMGNVVVKKSTHVVVN